MDQLSISWVATRAVWAYRSPREAFVAPRTAMSEIATTAMKKIAPATSDSRRVNPRALRTPGLIALNLGCSIVEENDVPNDRVVGRVGDPDAVREHDRARSHRHLPVHVEADRERIGLHHTRTGHHDEGLAPAGGQPVAVPVQAVGERRVADDVVGRVLLPEDERLVRVRTDRRAGALCPEVVALRGALADGGRPDRLELLEDVPGLSAHPGHLARAGQGAAGH